MDHAAKMEAIKTIRCPSCVGYCWHLHHMEPVARPALWHALFGLWHHPSCPMVKPRHLLPVGTVLRASRQ